MNPSDKDLKAASDKYYTEISSAHELGQSLNKLVDRGYKIVSVFPSGFFQDEAWFVVLAERIET